MKYFRYKFWVPGKGLPRVRKSGLGQRIKQLSFWNSNQWEDRRISHTKAGLNFHGKAFRKPTSFVLILRVHGNQPAYKGWDAAMMRGC